jgi:hypothetical protein|tara:strand:+ start:32 stop:160 length:129 start_codon:yes stop_codon:yes gene_type:complete
MAGQAEMFLEFFVAVNLQSDKATLNEKLPGRTLYLDQMHFAS